MVTLLATVMSTLDSYSFVSAMTLGNDLFRPAVIKLGLDERKFSTQRLTRAGLVITAAAGIILAIVIPSPVELIYMMASIAVPGLLVPLLLTYTNRDLIRGKIILPVMIISSGASLIWIFLKTMAENKGCRRTRHLRPNRFHLPGDFRPAEKLVADVTSRFKGLKRF